MKYPGLVAAVLLVCGMGAGHLFAQAAAESVLTHGLSSAAGSSLGKALGNAMGNAASQMGGRLGQQTSTPSAVKRVPGTRNKTVSVPALAATPGTASSSGSLIASIQGGATSSPAATCGATATSLQPDSSQSKSSPAVPSAAAPVAPSRAATPATNCQTARGAQDHPAVVNLPAAN